MGFIRTILIGIDAIIYTILEQIFQLIINLANFDLFSGDVLNSFSQRIYLILGLVMVFKLILSFIQILIDPDKISDKETGVANILKRVVISMILIVLVPSIFTFAKQLQEKVIPLIPKVVLGIPLDVDDSRISYDETTTDPIAKLEDEQGNVLVSTGKLMAYYSFLPFFYYNSGCDGMGGNASLGTLNGTTSADNSMNVEIYSVQDAVPHVNDKSGCSTTSDGYDYNYRYIISTLVGAYLVYVLVTVALKIAIRAIKFGICELIAPIPIASYIDPKSSKKAFDNWVSTSVKVYLDLFVRLIVVYFVVYIFKILFDGEKFIETLGKYGPFQGLLVSLFIITGLINFAKEMPKFVSDMLGVPDGFSDIGDMFKGQGFREIGSTIGRVGAMPAASIMAGIRARRKSIESGESSQVARYRARRAALNASTKFISNRFSGKNATESYKAGLDSALSKNEKEIGRTAGYTPPGQHATMENVRESNREYRRARRAQVMGASLPDAGYEAAMKVLSDTNSSIDKARKIAEGTKVGKLLAREEAAVNSMSVDGLRSRLIHELEDLENGERSGSLNAAQRGRLNQIRTTSGATQNSAGRWVYNLSDDGYIESQRTVMATAANQKFNDFVKDTVQAVTDAGFRNGDYNARYAAENARFGFADANAMLADGGKGDLMRHELDGANIRLQNAYAQNGVIRDIFDVGGAGEAFFDGTNFAVGNRNIYDLNDGQVSEISHDPRYLQAKATSDSLRNDNGGH